MFNQFPRLFTTALALIGLMAQIAFCQGTAAEKAAAIDFSQKIRNLPYADTYIIRTTKSSNTTYGMDVYVSDTMLKQPYARKTQIANQLHSLWYSCLKDNGSHIDNAKWSALVLWDVRGKCVANTVNDSKPYMKVFSGLVEPKEPQQIQVKNTYSTPKPGSDERKAIMDALRKPVTRQYKRQVIFKVFELKVKDGWAFVSVDPQDSKGKSLSGPDDMGDTEALLRKQAGVWKVLMLGGGSDVSFMVDAQNKYPRAPKTIFSYAVNSH